MIRALACCLALAPFAVNAQQASSASGGDLRILDKVTGVATDITLADGETRQVGYLRVNLQDCRYPSANPSGDAYAAVTVWYRDGDAPIFSGWLIASSPALNAVDHPRYDVWILRCSTS